MANTRNRANQGGSTWVVSGDLDVASSGSVNVQSDGKFVCESGGVNQQRPVTALTTANSTGTALEPSSIVHFNSSGIEGDTYTVEAPLAGEEFTAYIDKQSTAVNLLSFGVEIGSSEGVNANNKFLTGTTGTGSYAHLVAASSTLWICDSIYGFTVTTG